MCQLTFINVRNKSFILQHLVTQLIINSRHTHQDGAGIFIQDKTAKDAKFGRVIKTAIAPAECSNLAKFFSNKITKTSPVIAHVRKASTRVKEVKTEHAHPFRQKNKNIILAHNGTLEFKDPSREKQIEKEFPDMIDSQIFLEVLAKNYTKGEMFESLVKTMKLFKGKFAFLIYEGQTGKYFVVRGKATLFKAEVFLNEKNIGYVINTSKDDLELALHLTAQAWPLNKTTKLTYGKAEPLKEETIYIVGKNTVTPCGEIKETVGWVTNIPLRGRSRSPYYDDYWDNVDTPGPKEEAQKKSGTSSTSTGSLVSELITQPTKRFEQAEKHLLEFTTEFQLSIVETDALLWTTCGATISSITPLQIKYLTEILAPRLRIHIEENGGSTLFKAKAKKWKKIRKIALCMSELELYDLFRELEFPYFLNDMNIIHDVELYYRKQNKEKDKERITP